MLSNKRNIIIYFLFILNCFAVHSHDNSGSNQQAMTAMIAVVEHQSLLPKSWQVAFDKLESEPTSRAVSFESDSAFASRAASLDADVVIPSKKVSVRGLRAQMSKLFCALREDELSTKDRHAKIEELHGLVIQFKPTWNAEQRTQLIKYNLGIRD